jgi:hypothetical protein
MNYRRVSVRFLPFCFKKSTLLLGRPPLTLASGWVVTFPLATPKSIPDWARAPFLVVLLANKHRHKSSPKIHTHKERKKERKKERERELVWIVSVEGCNT